MAEAFFILYSILLYFVVKKWIEVEDAFKRMVHF